MLHASDLAQGHSHTHGRTDKLAQQQPQVTGGITPEPAWCCERVCVCVCDVFVRSLICVLWLLLMYSVVKQRDRLCDSIGV